VARRNRRWPYLVLGALIVAAACRGAASVILDLPPEEAPAASIGEVPREVSRPVQGAARPAIEAILQPDSVLAFLPRDSGGNVDWIAAVRSGVVRPRSSLPGRPAPPDVQGFRLDFYLEGPNQMFDALFPHSSHVKWLDCNGCHPTVVRYLHKPTSMEEINRGEACGRCHGPVAFPPSACFRCHTAMPSGGKVTATLQTDIVFPRDTAVVAPSYPPSRFPHWVHRIRYRCTACHADVFEMRLGSTPMSMAAMRDGQACGVCHDGRAAFGLTACDRCHVSAIQSEVPGP